MNLTELTEYFDSLLDLAAWKGRDNSLNGLQISRRDPLSPITRVAFAVDACLETFERAVADQAQILVVHHGLYWGRELALTGEHYRRIRYVMDNDLALYAAHLPLDAHPEVGNNAGMAQALGLTDLEPFGIYKGAPIGFKGRLPQALDVNTICEVLFRGREQVLQILPFGPKSIQTVGLVSGGAPYEVLQAIEQGLDLFITGDASHTIYHTALEAKMNVIFGGHYATETWGVRLLAQKLSKSKGLAVSFLDVPTGL